MSKLLPWATGLALVLAACGSKPMTWPQVEREIQEQFPDVPSLTTAELAARLEEGARVLLVDVRSAEEYAVSRLPDAALLADGEGLEEFVAGHPDAALVVVYCSVGYRSAALVEGLAGRPGPPVRNLAGSLFRWANEGRPLVNDQGPTGTVHPFNEQWGALLDPAHRADVD